MLGLGAQELVGVDLAERAVPGMTTVRADLRQLPFGASSFDLVFCVSTLEHVGGDNTCYDLAAEQTPDAIVIREAEVAAGAKWFQQQ